MTVAIPANGVRIARAGTSPARNRNDHPTNVERNHRMQTKTQDDLGYPMITEGLDAVRDSIATAGLERHVMDLEIDGYTIVPDVLPADTVAELRADLLSLAAADAGSPVDAVAGTSHRDRTQEVALLFARGGHTMRETVLNPRTLPLIRYLLGESCVLSSLTGYVKGPGKCQLGIHSDTAYVPDPLPPYAQLANVNLLLSDYTAADGCLTMVPGSHRYCYRPREGQGGRECVPVVAPAGSAVVFHGNTWHGAAPRERDGVRLTLSLLYARLYMRVQENYAEAMAAAELDTLPAEMRALVAPELPTGWRSVDDADAMFARRRSNSRLYYRTRGQHA
ncbi:phytanoyl-CoA dioxygenase family protein [Micromonospora lupini]|uniref:phytanoyl-CoA dioxygenase family protein n=1 Tax=Micromonospora lupini TaxID=285679 RepID=UPI0033F7055A